MAQTRQGETGAAEAQADGVIIDITIGSTPDAVSVRQRKPDLSRILEGRTVEDALSLIPLLLPVCGVAQTVAAQRAIEAARQTPADESVERDRSVFLLIEQAVSQAWRLAMDWTSLLSKQPDVTALKRVRDAATSSRTAVTKAPDELAMRLSGLADAVGSMIPELQSLQTDDHADIKARLDRGESIAAQIWQQTTTIGQRLADTAHTSDIICCRAEALEQLAVRAFQEEPFDSAAPHLDTPIDIGPNAWQGGEHYDLASQMLATITSTLDTIRMLRRWPHDDSSPADPFKSRVEGMGIGSAMTARGPVFHAIELDGEIVTKWRILAPTDWHFAPAGAVVTALRNAGSGTSDELVARYIITGFDPCARYILKRDDADA